MNRVRQFTHRASLPQVHTVSAGNQAEQHIPQAWEDSLNILQRQHMQELKNLLNDVLENVDKEYALKIDAMQEDCDGKLKDLQGQLTQSNEQLTDTVKMYNGLLHDVTDQVSLLQQALVDQEASHAVEMAELKRKLSVSECQVEDTSASYSQLLADMRRQVAALKEHIRNDELKFQQKRLVLMQANNALQKENQRLTKQLASLGHVPQASDDGSWNEPFGSESLSARSIVEASPDTAAS